jgi:GLPGLI family protein
LTLKKTFYILIIIIVSATIYSCGGSSTGKSEGIILYKVTYPKMDKHNIMFDFMPNKMVMKFKDNKYTTDLSAGMGMFKTNFIVDKESDQFSQLVKLINKKYVLTLKGENIEKSLKLLPKLKVKLTDETKKILGYNCKKAIITIDNEAQEVFTVYYTNQIEIESPNWCNQFKEIDGVMLEYQYEKYDVCMRLKAQSIKFTKIDDSEFEIDEAYENISEDKMDIEMKEIFDSFN